MGIQGGDSGRPRHMTRATHNAHRKTWRQVLHGSIRPRRIPADTLYHLCSTPAEALHRATCRPRPCTTSGCRAVTLQQCRPCDYWCNPSSTPAVAALPVIGTDIAPASRLPGSRKVADESLCFDRNGLVAVAAAGPCWPPSAANEDGNPASCNRAPLEPPARPLRTGDSFDKACGARLTRTPQITHPPSGLPTYSESPPTHGRSHRLFVVRQGTNHLREAHRAPLCASCTDDIR